MSISHVSPLKLNEIPSNLQSGILALKWPEDTKKSANPTIVNLSIDAKGYYLICLDKVKKEIECFDIALIHDTRTGSQVQLPQGAERSAQLNIGQLDVTPTLKWLTIYYGNTFVPSSDFRIIHFSFESQNTAREWTEKLFRYGHNQHLRNLSSLECLEKLHSNIIHSLIDLNKKTISIRKLILFLCKNSRDIIKETKIRRTLEYLNLPHQNDSVIHPDHFTFDIFFRFYIHVMERDEISNLFESIDVKHRRYINWEHLKVFIKKQDNISNDSYEMDYYEQKAKDLIKKYTRNDEHSKEKGMCDESFLRYLLSFDNLIIDPTKLELFMDMDKPLSHYFISSSHNTYLTGNQLAGRASIEMYRQVLLTGCRCIELDVVDSERRRDEPEIKHKNTPVRPVLFIDVIVTIRDYAFKVTPYPLILSIENHCGAKAQQKMAQYLVDIFGESLITEPLKTHPCEVNQPLPSPNDLKYKILIKNKKLDSNPIIKSSCPNISKPGTISASSSSGQSTDVSTIASSPTPSYITSSSDELYQRDPNKINDDEGFSEDEIPITNEIQSLNNSTAYETKATKAMSDLVHYIVPIRFKSFSLSEERNRSFEMSSFTEDRAQNLNRDSPKEFLAYNQRQLSRIYPRGTRFDSTNYNPYPFWRIGCQMVALNYQTLDVPMQLNLSLFSFNGACGYIEKPSPLCQTRNLFDPKVSTHVENVVGCEIDIKILSGQFLCQDREPIHVDIQMYGMYGDENKRHEHHVRAKRWNGFQAVYDDTDIHSNETSIKFTKIILPEMAALRFIVSTEDGILIGQSFIPIVYLRSGYRHIVLRNQLNIPINSSSLFVYIRKNSYIDAKDELLANKLAQPLLNQSEKDLNNEKNFSNDISSSMLVRIHTPLIYESDENSRRRNSSTLFDESNWYQKHLIAASKLNDKKTLCKVLSLNDIEQKEILKRNQAIQPKLRRVSVDFQKKIQTEEDRFQKCLQSYRDKSTKTNKNQINQKDFQEIEQPLLAIYFEKFQKQQELERKNLNDYYIKLEKYINEDCNKQLSQIESILKEEKSRVDKQVRSQIKREADNIQTHETDRDTISMLKAKSSQTNDQVRTSTIQTLEEMCKQVKDILQTNLHISLDQLEQQRCIERDNCVKQYSNKFKEIKLRLERQMNNGECDTSINDSNSTYY